MAAIDDDSAQVARPSESRRDPQWLRERLDRWLKSQAGPDAEITDVTIPESNGMSSETLLAEATWGGEDRRLVVRVAPQADSDPVFPHYDLDGQYRIIEHVRAHSDVPLPRLWWSEPSDAALGAPFFVMDRVDGEVPPDVMPYNFGSWVSEATDEQRTALMRGSVSVLARVHSVPIPDVFVARPTGDDSPLRAHVRRLRGFYDWAARDRAGSPLIDRAFTWIEANLPETDENVLTWGDARIGNIMYRDFAPVAVLDWEMAAIGPRELDVAWMIFLHRFFQDLATMAGMDGLPDFLRREDVAAEYLRQTGHQPQHLDFYTAYAALIHAVVMFRIQCRAIHFGHAQEPADPDELIMHRATLDAMLAGTYWGQIS
ncbi:phosphotransferase family protein [Gordonia hydrophobica]|uniref:Phosphotransferase family protein n=1 Tax=Gordonia hydrophobica TaxID=40516 RepID=A0ABZ2U2N5_9ACTN|nr:phosphotransferase family protein [Gordonia hydrophobica]MBM7369084.1 aminoglycoside phosphotransferase (APT) family kinase protein [Gordonia hydrophobica]